jgi:hypothetical protein
MMGVEKKMGNRMKGKRLGEKTALSLLYWSLWLSREDKANN